VIEGENLAVDPSFPPVAVVNEKLAEVMSSTEHEVKIEITDDHALTTNNEVILTVDPFAVMRMNVRM
jgi:hypothetical protein